jgi:hypothetical protein
VKYTGNKVIVSDHSESDCTIDVHHFGDKSKPVRKLIDFITIQTIARVSFKDFLAIWVELLARK